MSEDCIKCHSFKGWKDLEIDHDKDAAYRLTGRHIDVKCELCHPRYTVRGKSGDTEKTYEMLKFKPLEYGKCDDCHKDDHKGKYKDIEKVEGVTCDNCHFIDKEWREYVYKHKQGSNYSRYNPEGQIKESNCEECHVCEAEAFCLTCCFERMGLIPAR